MVPSPQGTKWGLGGTCVNVGCIPKKLFHRASLLREAQRDMPFYGWQLQEVVQHDWNTLVTNVGDYIKSLNWSYLSELRTAKVDYFNEFAVFVDRHTVEATDKDGKKVSCPFLFSNPLHLSHQLTFYLSPFFLSAT